MKYIFRGNIIFEYIPEKKRVIQHKIHGQIPAFDYCIFTTKDYHLISKFFLTAYLHIEGHEVELEDIVVN